MSYATLPHRSVLQLSGEDTLSFLQGLVSNDVLSLPQKGAVYTALLTPQGKFLHDFFMIAHEGGVLLEGNAARMSELHQRLMKYRLRSKVNIQAMPDAVGAVWDQPEFSADGVVVFRDPRLAELGWRVIGDAALNDAGADAYNLHRLSLGVPEGDSDLVPEKSFLLPFGFEDLHGVDFKKGCYVGQEVTARSKHLGQVRKRIYKVRSTGGDLPAAGSAVYYGEINAGELRSVHGDIGLALMSVEAVEKAAQLQVGFHCASVALELQLPHWIKSI